VFFTAPVQTLSGDIPTRTVYLAATREAGGHLGKKATASTEQVWPPEHMALRVFRSHNLTESSKLRPLKSFIREKATEVTRPIPSRARSEGTLELPGFTRPQIHTDHNHHWLGACCQARSHRIDAFLCFCFPFELSRMHIPYAHIPIFTSAGQKAAIRREGHE
jgi:hypothetical protein